MALLGLATDSASRSTAAERRQSSGFHLTARHNSSAPCLSDTRQPSTTPAAADLILGLGSNMCLGMRSHVPSADVLEPQGGLLRTICKRPRQECCEAACICGVDMRGGKDGGKGTYRQTGIYCRVVIARSDVVYEVGVRVYGEPERQLCMNVWQGCCGGGGLTPRIPSVRLNSGVYTCTATNKVRHRSAGMQRCSLTGPNVLPLLPSCEICSGSSPAKLGSVCFVARIFPQKNRERGPDAAQRVCSRAHETDSLCEAEG